jgi:hypothetical protein
MASTAGVPRKDDSEPNLRRMAIQCYHHDSNTNTATGSEAFKDFLQGNALKESTTQYEGIAEKLKSVVD